MPKAQPKYQHTENRVSRLNVELDAMKRLSNSSGISIEQRLAADQTRIRLIQAIKALSHLAELQKSESFFSLPEIDNQA